MFIGQLTTGRTGPLQSPNRKSVGNVELAKAGASFREVLSNQELKFSHHAEMRLQQRGIKLNSDQLGRIESAIDQAAAKGAKDSLVLFKGIAMIVNVPNRTVVTAMDGASMNEHVFTQIDSAVVVN
ncbi:flagellar biosynthesis protein [Cohnella faecalis]|uniref:Flagellar biosynthesis protein n=2 Tax=Cohnella faecalis TaxID=2315694 RepID=A0A398CPS1_9BACL|nr:flagellar biosynthesis protein [Cohnella faecalis]